MKRCKVPTVFSLDLCVYLNIFQDVSSSKHKQRQTVALSKQPVPQRHKRSYNVGGFRPYLRATSVWAYAASQREYKWAISISDLARLIALLNISMALSRLPLRRTTIWFTQVPTRVY